jgi:hypothetical protein
LNPPIAVRRAVTPRAQMIVDSFQRNVTCFRHRKKQPNHCASGNREPCDEHGEQRRQPFARGAARHDESDAEQRGGGARAMWLIVRPRSRWLRERSQRGENISHSARVMPTMAAVSKPNDIPARLATMMTLMCATPSVDFCSTPRSCAWTSRKC